MDWTTRNVNPAKVVPRRPMKARSMFSDIDEERRRISLGVKAVPDQSVEGVSPITTTAATRSRPDSSRSRIFGFFHRTRRCNRRSGIWSDYFMGHAGRRTVAQLSKAQQGRRPMVLSIDPERERISFRGSSQPPRRIPLPAYIARAPERSASSTGWCEKWTAKGAITIWGNGGRRSVSGFELSRRPRGRCAKTCFLKWAGSRSQIPAWDRKAEPSRCRSSKGERTSN